MRCTLRRRTRASVTELGYEFPESASYCSHSRDLSTRTQSPALRDPSWSVEMTEIGGRAVAEPNVFTPMQIAANSNWSQRLPNSSLLLLIARTHLINGFTREVLMGRAKPQAPCHSERSEESPCSMHARRP